MMQLGIPRCTTSDCINVGIPNTSYLPWRWETVLNFFRNLPECVSEQEDPARGYWFQLRISRNDTERISSLTDMLMEDDEYTNEPIFFDLDSQVYRSMIESTVRETLMFYASEDTVDMFRDENTDDYYESLISDIQDTLDVFSMTLANLNPNFPDVFGVNYSINFSQDYIVNTFNTWLATYRRSLFVSLPRLGQPRVGVAYSLDEFRGLEEMRNPVYMGPRALADEYCDFDNTEPKKEPVKVLVERERPSNLRPNYEWDKEGTVLYVFCAKELRQWLVQFNDEYNMFQDTNPFTRKIIYRVQYLTEAEAQSEWRARTRRQTPLKM